MNLYHLRYFSTLAHIEHYTKAADILAITQPSLSYAISTLEEELGVKLFEKNGRNVTLTKYGKVFLNDVEEVLNRLDSSVNSLKLAGKGEGCIDVAFLRTLGIDFLPKIMRGFLAANPTKKIDFNLYCDKVLTADILNGLKEKKYDLGFCSMIDNEPLIEFIPVARQELVVIVPSDHPLAAKEEVCLEDTIPYKQIDQRSLRGTYTAGSRTFLYAGRMILSALMSSSIRCALHPTIRATANIGVYNSSGRSSILYTKPL